MRKEAVYTLLLNVTLFTGMRCTLAQDPRFVRFSVIEHGVTTHYNLKVKCRLFVHSEVCTHTLFSLPLRKLQRIFWKKLMQIFPLESSLMSMGLEVPGVQYDQTTFCLISMCSSTVLSSFAM